MATTKQIISLAISAYVVVPKDDIKEQIKILTLMSTAHETNDYSEILKIAKVETVSAKQMNRRFEDFPPAGSPPSPEPTPLEKAIEQEKSNIAAAARTAADHQASDKAQPATLVASGAAAPKTNPINPAILAAAEAAKKAKQTDAEKLATIVQAEVSGDIIPDDEPEGETVVWEDPPHDEDGVIVEPEPEPTVEVAPPAVTSGTRRRVAR